MSRQSAEQSSVGEEERLWGFIAWLLSIVGAILAMVLKPSYRYAKYWAYLSISFFIVAIAASALGAVLSIVPLLGHIFSALISLALFVTWVIGLVKSLQMTWWRPPLVYDIAKAIGVEKI